MVDDLLRTDIVNRVDTSKVAKYKIQKSSEVLPSVFVLKKNIKNSSASENSKTIDDLQYYSR